MVTPLSPAKWQDILLHNMELSITIACDFQHLSACRGSHLFQTNSSCSATQSPETYSHCSSYCTRSVSRWHAQHCGHKQEQDDCQKGCMVSACAFAPFRLWSGCIFRPMASVPGVDCWLHGLNNNKLQIAIRIMSLADKGNSGLVLVR